MPKLLGYFEVGCQLFRGAEFFMTPDARPMTQARIDHYIGLRIVKSTIEQSVCKQVKLHMH